MQAAGDTLVLRDIHAATAPAWWPPAPGWWGLAAVLLLAGGAIAWWVLARRRRRRRMLALFDAEVAAATSPAAAIAAISALLRRAARRVRADADTLRGDDWLAFVDDGAAPRFQPDALALLRDGAYRPAPGADAAALDALRFAARARFDAWTRP